MIAAQWVPLRNLSRHARPARVAFRWIAALSLAVAFSSALALAEEADETAEAEERRSVASHIRTAWGDTVRPVAVIDREDIALSGARFVSELLFDRLSTNGFGLHRPFVLGAGRAAVLINGRRISDSTLDLSTLPTSEVAPENRAGR